MREHTPVEERGVDVGEMSPWHWALVIAVALLLFGAKRLPDAARSVGRSARILRAELHGDARPSPDGGDGDPAGPRHRRRSVRRGSGPAPG